MSDHEIVILVEERSSAIVIQHLSETLGLRRRIRIFRHDGLGDLRNSIPRKLNAEPHELTRFIILCDADAANCEHRKRELFALVPPAKRSRTIVRIACRELEAWYIAQPNALSLGGALKTRISKNLLSRNPDQIANANEEFMKFAHRRGQIELARKIGPYLDPENSKSKSFFHFVLALRNSAS